MFFCLVIGCSQTKPINNIGKLLMTEDELQNNPATDCEANYLIRKRYTLTSPDQQNWSGQSVVYVFSALGSNTREQAKCLVTGRFSPPRYNKNLDTFIVALIDLELNGLIYYAVKQDNMFTVRKVAIMDNKKFYAAEDYCYKDLPTVIKQLERGSIFIPMKSERREDYYSVNGLIALYNTFTEGNTVELLEEAKQLYK